VGSLLLKHAQTRVGGETKAWAAVAPASVPDSLLEDITVRACIAGSPPAGVRAASVVYPTPSHGVLQVCGPLVVTACVLFGVCLFFVLALFFCLFV
jgi:hypothetical protein